MPIAIPFRTAALWAAIGVLAAADPAAEALAGLRDANRQRAELAREAAAWSRERQRLDALVEATAAEVARLEAAASAAEMRRDAARAASAVLAPATRAAVLASLTTAAATVRADLERLAGELPPGTVAVPAGDPEMGGFAAAARAVEAAERAAGTVAVGVASGERDGHAETVRILRVAGAAAWWMSLDGTAAGILVRQEGRSRLLAVDEPAARDAIRTAIAQVDGHATAAIALLPAASP